MKRMALIKGAAAIGGLALTLAAGTGIASADPTTDPMINSTCTYDQWVAALHAQNPGPASAFDSQPASQSFVRQFIESSPQERVGLVNVVKGMPGADQNLPVIQQAFSACNSY
jgi:hemophore-related protein